MRGREVCDKETDCIPTASRCERRCSQSVSEGPCRRCRRGLKKDVVWSDEDWGWLRPRGWRRVGWNCSHIQEVRRWGKEERGASVGDIGSSGTPALELGRSRWRCKGRTRCREVLCGGSSAFVFRRIEEREGRAVGECFLEWGEENREKGTVLEAE